MDDAYRRELRLHVKQLHDNYTTSVDTATVLIMNGMVPDAVSTDASNSTVLDIQSRDQIDPPVG
eukprot:3113476-Rhodomonas_salina.1